MAEPQFRAVYPDSSEFPPAEAVNHFRFSRVGTEVQMLAGYLDLTLLVAAINRGQQIVGGSDESGKGEDLAIDLPVEVTHRLYLSNRAFAELKEKVDEIYDAMVKSGHIDDGADDGGAEHVG